VLLVVIERNVSATIPLNFGTWILAGVLIALGVLVPGLSPSNFMVFFGLYTPMVRAFGSLDLSVLLPLLLGFFACLFALSRLMDWLFARAYTGLFHLVLGLVFASTLMIIPLDYNYLQLSALSCLATLAAGTALGWWMCRLETKYK
jgi:putative membrane protein